MFQIEIIQQVPEKSLGLYRDLGTGKPIGFLTREAAEDARLTLIRSGMPNLTYRIHENLGGEWPK